MIEIVESNYTKDGHEKVIIELLNRYATDIMGGGEPLSDSVKENLVHELEKRSGIYTVLAFVDSVAAGILPAETDELLMIANVFVHPSASRRKRIHINNYKAMRNAIRHAMEGTPTTEDALEHARSARHPFRDEI